jgi:DNA (cytosine-5)-methyltransferase 1
LYCGAGGASAGYAAAGFEVTGLDLRPQRNYPFTFIRASAPWYLHYHRRLIRETYDVIAASPPCQAHSKARTIRAYEPRERPHGDFLTPTRALLEDIGLPFVIENVPGAPMETDLMLCGSHFSLSHNGWGLRRHRLFEFGCGATAPAQPVCNHVLPPLYVYGHGADLGHQHRYKKSTVADWRGVMQIDWMTRDELAQAIPPSFTEYIGRHLERPENRLTEAPI